MVEDVQFLQIAPGLQVYTGNGMQNGPAGKPGRPYPRWGGVALETQPFPDAPHQAAFPSILLRPGAVYRSSTAFRLGVSPL